MAARSCRPIYQGTRIGNEAAPVANAELGNIKNPRLDHAAQRLQLDLVQSMNRELLERERSIPASTASSSRTSWRSGCRARCPR